MNFYQGKNVLVTGGTGLIGQPLVNLLLAAGAHVRVVSLDKPALAPSGVEFHSADLREFRACTEACRDMEIVMQLAGVKGSPAMTATRPASFFVPTLMFSINMMEAARRARVSRYLFTSSIGVYAPAEVMREDDVWQTFPSPNDRFAGWAKRMGELQAEAYRIEHGWDKISIVRPANVYGPFDNFDPENAMVIPSLVRRVVNGENPLRVWGDGSPVRDFIYAEDVARGMMLAVEKGINVPINLGSGLGVSVRNVVEILAELANGSLAIEWDISKPAGDKRRVMDSARAKAAGFVPGVSLRDGIRATMEWYKGHRESGEGRYNSFTELAHLPAPNPASR